MKLIAAAAEETRMAGNSDTIVGQVSVLMVAARLAQPSSL